MKRSGISHHIKKFTHWDHFISLLFCQMAGANSLREISNGLKSCTGKLNHLGMNSAPSTSNLAYCNKNRSYEQFEDVFYTLLERCQQRFWLWIDDPFEKSHSPPDIQQEIDFMTARN